MKKFKYQVEFKDVVNGGSTIFVQPSADLQQCVSALSKYLINSVDGETILISFVVMEVPIVNEQTNVEK